MQKLLSLFKNQIVIKYLVAILLIIVPLYPKFPLLNIVGTYVAIRLEDLFLLIVGVFVFVNVITDFKSFIGDKLFRSLIIFFVVGLVSLISGIYLTKTVDLRIGVLHLLRRVEYVIPFIAILRLFKTETFIKSLSYYLWIIVIVGGVLFVYGVGQRYFSFPIIITQNQEYSKGVALRYTPGSHINSTFAGHYDLASYMVLIMPVILSLMLLIKNKSQKIVLGIVSVFCMWLLVNSLSRIAQISFLVSISIALLLIKKYKELIVVILISLLFILTSAGLYQRFSRFFTVYAEEIKVEQVVEDRSTNIRLAVEWPRAIRSFTKNSLLGTGYSSIGLAVDNDYLRALGETGILGVIAFGLLIFNLIKELFNGFPFTSNFEGIELAVVAGTFGAILGTLITATFIDIFEASKFATMFWIMVGFAVYLVRNLKYEHKK